MALYEIFADGELLYSTDIIAEDMAVVSPKVTLVLGEEGSAEFTVLPTHYLYSELHRLKTRIKIYQEGDLIFSGRINEITTDMYLQKQCSCEGDLNLLLDSVQPQIKVSANPGISVREFIRRVLDAHNSQVEEWKQFKIGEITISGADDGNAFETDAYAISKDVLTDNLTGVFGGYFQVRYGYEAVSQTPKKGVDYEEFPRIMKYGSKGDDVKRMQERLNSRNYNTGTPDGKFGSNTEAGLNSFKMAMGLTQNGIYDEETHIQLMGEINGWESGGKVERMYLDYLMDPYIETIQQSVATNDDFAYNAAVDKLKYGSKGDRVVTLQQRLITLGYSVGSTTTDGKFGNNTEAGLKNFQTWAKANGFPDVKVDGVYDQATHYALINTLYPTAGSTVINEIKPNNDQAIHFGVNMVNMSGEYPIDEVFTILLPLGKDNRTIADANNGSIYLENAAAIQEFGRIVKANTWSEISDATKLKQVAEQYLKSHSMIFPETLTITAIDQHLLDKSKGKFKIGKWINVVVDPRNLDQTLCCTEMELDLAEPGNNSYKLGYYIPFNFDGDYKDRKTSTSGNISGKI